MEKQILTEKIEQSNNNFYFWLGEDGELEDLETEEEFLKRMAAIKKVHEDWENVVG